MRSDVVTGLVRISTPGGVVVGAGLVVDDRHVVTCAHVVMAALQLSAGATEWPGGAVILDFPALGGGKTSARVVPDGWIPIKEDGRGDVAVLELEGSPPPDATAPVIRVARGSLGHRVMAYGFPRGVDSGMAATGRLLGQVGLGWQLVQIGAEGSGAPIESGFSGSPVWDLDLGAVVGIITAQDRRPWVRGEAQTAWMIPAEVLAQAWPPMSELIRSPLLLDPALPTHWDSYTADEIPQPRRRYLKAQCPESIPVGKPFSLLASIVMAADPSTVELEPLAVPPEGRHVLLVVHAPGLRLIGDQRQTVHVPAVGDSRPVMFELCADAPGPRRASITAWIGGSYLGELLVEITAERDRPARPHRDVLAEITTEPAEDAVSLVVRFDPVQNAYRFEFRDEDNPDEVTSNLAYDPGPLVEQLVADLDNLAKGRSGYSADQTRDYLINAGARLWSQLVPAQLREQFWDRQHRIRQLTILADKDTVPWELLYPMDPGHDAGFLVEQFPVTRAIFRWLPSRTLHLWPARFVLPEGSLPEARNEINAMRRLLDPGHPPSEVISALTPLQDLIANGNFGLLHFACHNTYNPAAGSSITLDNVQFTPTLMTTAAINKMLARSAPTVFMNACRSAGLHATFNRLDGWASKFLEAGAGAFIGSLWAVSDGAAREFAQEFYGRLMAGFSLGEAVMQARQAAASQPDDPTWLAYTAYGNPRATISHQRP
jgi:CHAT domain-containing protein/trypsin-like peptidase